ncbi:hypothetical protein LR48_Vigan09g064600 [Vigna angularis]|uniref:Uncharacterized protein n=1 Tax=Phaseolus angularis TaxID=3914 RepID=A0A0L9VAQ5_PHAAN|nr:hypothetical protein LR48_Vigan09g064600 [Vigna angularis]
MKLMKEVKRNGDEIRKGHKQCIKWKKPQVPLRGIFPLSGSTAEGHFPPERQLPKHAAEGQFPDTQPLADGSTRADVRSSLPPRPTPRPTPPTIPTTPPTILTPPPTIRPPTIRPTPSIVPPTPNPIVDPTPIIDLSPSITKTSFIQSIDVEEQLDDPDNMIDPFPNHQPSIEPYGKGVASQAITRTIKQQFLQPWTSWGAILEDDQENFWKRFKEEFSTRLTQARSEVGSTLDAASRTYANDDIMKTQCWVDVVGGKKKGRVYGAGQLASNYSGARGGILKHQPSTSNNTEQINMVSREAYDAVITRLKTLEDMFRKYIPQEEVSGPSSSHQPHSPTQPMQSTPVQPPLQQQHTLVQQPVQQQLPQEEEEDDYDEYIGY